ncbi:SMC-Scp complex subunit ScpB, partial [Syntrophorhabdus aromaticivorans]|uniref:SMC-Scp complex subunit ScpB n=1 Tax=Syntrophorhabdus aromaticivorans TaxID=328301 RepID=UPI0003F6F1C0
MMELGRIIEAILFSSPKPVKLKALSKKLDGYTDDDIKQALRELTEEYRNSDRSIEIIPVSGGYQMRTRMEYREWVKRFVKERSAGLTRPMLEALSLVAYKQPITKREIDTFRGVDSARVIKQLIEKKLIEIAGRTEDVGKPIAFRTTDTFLEVYGLKGIEDLPTLKEIKELEK